MSKILNEVENFCNLISTSPEHFYVSKEKFLEFKNSSIQFMEEENLFSFEQALKNVNESFLKRLLVIEINFRKGRVKKAKVEINELAEKLEGRKLISRIENLIEFFKDNKSLLNSNIKNNYYIKSGQLEKIENGNIESYDFSAIKHNADIYLADNNAISTLVENTSLYQMSEVIEVILKAAPKLTFDKKFFTSVEKIAHVTGSQSVATSLKELIQKEGQSFGINIDKLDSLSRPVEEVKESSTDIDISITLQEPKKIKDEIHDGMSLYERAKTSMNNGDYVVALALLREEFSKNEIESNGYYNTLFEIAECYKCMELYNISQKIINFIKLKNPSFERLKTKTVTI